MPLHQLYLNSSSTSTLNPSYLNNLQPGGAGVQVAGTVATPGISAPRLEESAIEVLDTTAPTNLGPSVSSSFINPPAGIVSPVGKLLVMDVFRPGNIGGANWIQNQVRSQQLARGQYGIVSSPGQASDVPAGSTGLYGPTSGATATPLAGERSGYRSTGTKAVVVYDGPVNALVETVVGGIAISAGMPLVADGSGNLTAFSYQAPTGAPAAGPSAGTQLAIALGPVAASVSVPVAIPVYVGGF
jgi:hypothetical protein